MLGIFRVFACFDSRSCPFISHVDDEEATFNAVQCLDTIDSVLEAVQEKPDVLLLLEPITQPMIMKYVVLFALFLSGKALTWECLVVNVVIYCLFFSVRLLIEGDDLYEYIDSAVHMISGFTYYSDTISPYMWNLCGPLLQVLEDWAIDYIAEIMVPILNYVTKDIATFLRGTHEGKPLAIWLLEIVKKIFTNDE